MRDDRPQGVKILPGKRFDRRTPMHIAAERPRDLQPFVAHHGVELDQVRARLARAALARDRAR